MKNLTIDKHQFFNETMTQLNSTKNYYFIKTNEKVLNENITNIVENNTIKIVHSNFPDSIFLPLVVSLYGNTIPEYVLFIEGEGLINYNNANILTTWAENAYIKIMKNNLDYIFGNFQYINDKKIGCSILLTKASILQHLLYYTDSDTSHINPFIQLSFATQTKFSFSKLDFLKKSYLENNDINNNKFSLNVKCPSYVDSNNPSFCIMIPSFKRNYFPQILSTLNNQTVKPSFYIIIQNDNRLVHNFTLFQELVDSPIYHIWLQNWNSFFFLPHRLSAVFPVDFVLKYDDDQWPRDNTLNEIHIEKTKNKNSIYGFRGPLLPGRFCKYSPKNYKRTEAHQIDHTGTPFLARPGYFKLDARNKVYRLYGGEDISLCVNSYILCDVKIKRMKMKLVENHKDGNNQGKDKQIIEQVKLENETKFNLFTNTYCYYIQSGYIPRTWGEFTLPLNDSINITIEHKRLN